MDANINYSIIDVAEGNVTKEFSSDKVILKGKYPSKDSEYVGDLVLEIHPKNSSNIIKEKIPYSGYDLKLFVGDFSGDGRDDVLVRGAFGGSGGFEIVTIYSYIDGKLKNIFNQDMFSDKYKFMAKYLDGYKVYVKSFATGDEFIIDISLRPKQYLDIIYDKNGKTKPYNDINVDAISGAYPINYLYRDTYNLLLNQRIVGISNADTIGLIQSYIDLSNNEIKADRIGVLILGEGKTRSSKLEEYELNQIKLPGKSTIIPLDQFGGTKNFLKKDIDYDFKEEIILVYKLDGIPYLSVYKKDENKIVPMDTFKGVGYDLKDLKIENINGKTYILVGWKVGAVLNTLDILTIKNGKLKKVFKTKLPEYDKLYLEDIDLDGNEEIILWTHDTGEAYKIYIYEFKGNELRQTNKYDSLYFKKVKKYYENLVNKYKDSPVYMYYLALSQYKVLDYREALNTVNKVLNMKSPYPSTKELNKLKEKINKFINRIY